jgi:hypothetical protein
MLEKERDFFSIAHLPNGDVRLSKWEERRRMEELTGLRARMEKEHKD